MNAKLLKPAAIGATLSTLAGAALADSGAATAAISAAQTDALAVVGALTTMGVAIWGAYFIYKKFFAGK